jgi:uncharacterized protein YciI
VELVRYSFVLLRRPVDAPALPQAELDALQEQHLAFLKRMTDAGKLVAAGPFSEQLDEAFRGLCIYDTSLDEARTLAAGDPLVHAGRIAVDVMTWWTERGVVTFNRL